MKPLLALLPAAGLIGLIVYIKHEENSSCYRWNKELLVEDNRSCNMARAGDWTGADGRYEDCLRSLGYRREKVECIK